MDFKEWYFINEGFTIDTSKIPHEEIATALKDNDKKGLISLFLTQGKLRYSPNDKPSDLIRLAPINYARKVKYTQPDLFYREPEKHALESFKTAKIYYGFAFPSIFAFGDSHVIQPTPEPWNAPLKPGETPKWTPRGMLPKGDYAAGTANQPRTGVQWSGTDPESGSIDARIYSSPEWRTMQELELFISELTAGKLDNFMMRPIASELAYPTTAPPQTTPTQPQNKGGFTNSVYADPETHKPYNLSPDPKIAAQQATVLIRKLNSRYKVLEGRLGKMHGKIGYSMNKINSKELGEKYFYWLSTALVKILKDPQGAYGRKIQDQFMDIALRHFIDMSGGYKYDIIAYPESSKSFNKIFANKAAGILRAEEVREFKKVPASQINVDVENLRRRYEQNPQGFEGKKQYLNYLLRREPQNKPLQIKNIQDKESRRYINPFGSEGDYKGKRVLIIDDNVDSGGTFEVLYDMVIRQGPAQIDLYSPILMRHHH